MTFHLDLTDVAAHAAICPSLTGIQRVQLEFARFLARDVSRSAAIFADRRGASLDLAPLIADHRAAGAEELFMQMRRLFGPTRPPGLSRRSLPDFTANGAPTLTGAGAALRRAFGSPAGRFGPSDCLYVGGAFWAHPPSVKSYERAARAGCDVVVLFHDVLPLASADLADSGCRPLFERMLRLRARAITVSRHSRAEIEAARRALGAPSDLPPAIVAPLAHEFSAAPRDFVAGAPPSRRLAALAGPSPFVLSVGTIEPRKNHLALIRLWRSLAQEAGPGWPRLVLAGRPGWRAEETIWALKQADPAGPVAWIDAPTDAELAWLYSSCRFTVFPSLAEGWGLPIGESLWFGKPCVTSNAASMPEVGGALCLYADPRTIDSFAAPILRLAHDAEAYEGFVAAIRASRLRTWRESAEGLLRAALPAAEGGEPADAAPSTARSPVSS